MDLNPLKLLGRVVDQVDNFRRSRFIGYASKAASGLTSKIQTLEQYVPSQLRITDKVQYLAPTEVAKVYAQLAPKEKDAICEQLKVAAADSLTTSEAIAPIGANLTRRVVGRLVLPMDPAVEQRLGLHNLLVELWDRDFGEDVVLQRGTTDREGRFELWYDPNDAGVWDRPDLELRVFEVNHFYKRGTLHFQQKLIYTIKGAGNVTRQTYDFGECEVPYWQYDSNTSVPRLLVIQNGIAPQSFSPGRAVVMAAELASLELKKALHKRGFRSLHEI